MSDLIRKPYEISLWEDVLTFIDSTGEEHVTIDESLENPIIAQYYDEKKIAVIGSDTMNSPIRAVEGKLVSNINGSNTLTFSLYQKYYDEISDIEYDNPYIKFLVNERKIKLRYGPPENCKWYDLVIKNVQEDSVTKKFTYTAKDQFINELSKSGFDLEFNTELENNMGTVTTLGEAVLEGSDWKIANDCSTLLQYIEEPLYEVRLKDAISAKDMLTGDTITISSNKIIYVFYSVLADKSPSFQFLYGTNYQINEDRVITNAPASEISDRGSNYLLIGEVEYNENLTTGIIKPEFAQSAELITKYRGARLVRKAKTTYDKILDKYVYTYTKNGKEYYGYTETKYIEPMAVSNYITNPSDFLEGDSGWNVGGYLDGEETIYPELEATAYPDIFGGNSEQIEPVLAFKFNNIEQAIYNSGFADNRSNIEKLTQNDEYVFRIELKQAYGNKLDPISPNGILKIQIEEYELEDGCYTTKDVLFDFSNVTWKLDQITEDDYNEQGDPITKTRYFYYAKAACKKSLSYSELITKKIGIFIKPTSNILNKKRYITEAQFFPYLLGEKNNVEKMCVPGEIFEPRVETYYYYYPKNNSYTSAEDIVYSYSGLTNDPSYVLVYNDQEETENGIEAGYEKVRSLEASESNRFNLIQTLCETFECWADFRVAHTPQGKIQTVYQYVQNMKEEGETPEYEYTESLTFLPEKINYCIGKRQLKEIAFREYIGQDNKAGFKYGINLSSIVRTVDSDGFVSKIIVKNNSNEHAKDGFCSISRAKANPSSENFLYDFTYYINQGLLSLTQVTNDLYSSGFNNFLGYYTKLSEINANRDALIQENSEISISLMNAESNIKVYSESVHSCEEEITNAKLEIKSTTQYDYLQFKNVTTDQTASLYETLAEGKEDYNSWTGLTQSEYNTLVIINKTIADKFKNNLKGTASACEKAYEEVVNYKTWKESKEIVSLCTKILTLSKKRKAHQKLLDGASEIKTTLEDRQEEIKEALNKKLIEKEKLNKTFYHKYSRFIQEGSWISEDYIDDELYYLDAESTLHTSAQPKVSYDIKVLEISQIEGYENYNFSLGDKTYIEDTEFFGWVFNENSNLKSPYKEEVIVAEVTLSLDDPSINSLKIQNYKTQFEDLFQRITAATQAIEYSTGQYDKASGIVNSDGTINISTLQNSMANNAIVLSNAKDQSVVWDESGITTTCLTKPSEVVRIVSGGIFLSKDGGNTWQTGITGSGINASYITTGQLDTGVIRIMNGVHTSFRWDNLGLTAYKFTPTYDSNGVINGGTDFKAGIFTRFDQYGIYGISGNESFDANIPDEKNRKGEEKIWEVAKFALTWKGFSLRSEGTKGYIRISSDEDFKVLTNINGNLISRIHIGDLSEGAGSRYGLRIRDKDNQVVMETDDDGLLFLQKYMRIGPESEDAGRDRVKFGIVKNYLVENDNLTESTDAANSSLSKILSIKDTDSSTKKADTLGLETNEVLSMYDDGTLIAKRVIINGGRIGNMTIQEIENLNLKVDIQIIEGDNTIFRNAQDDDAKKLRATLVDLNGTPIIFTDKEVEYEWFANNESIGTGSELIVRAKQINNVTRAITIRCYITVTDPQTAESLVIN